MLKRFTSGALLICSMALGACSTVPMPFSNRDGADTPPREPASAPLEATAPGTLDAAALAPAVPLPPLRSGSQALFDRALELLQEGKLAAAEVLFTELTEDQPELAGPWVNLGYIHLARDDADKANEAFALALSANPQNCDALNQMGVQARREGRFADAERHYRACIEAQPLYANAHLNLAILYELYMGRLGEALVAYNDYQLMLSEPDGRVTGWVMDLERRVAAIATR